jgi:hypothetical protein
MTKPFAILGLPTYSGWSRTDQLKWLAEELASIHGWGRLLVMPVPHRNTPQARNQLADACLTLDVPLIMVDDDAVPAVGTIENVCLMFYPTQHIRRADILGFPYLASNENPCVWDVDAKRYTEAQAATMTGLTRIGNIGTHTVAYHPSVFKRMSPPWFHYVYNDRGTQLEGGEDTVFHQKCHEAGLALWCDWDHWSGHWKGRTINKPELQTDEFPEALAAIAGRWMLNDEKGRAFLDGLVAQRNGR